MNYTNLQIREIFHLEFLRWFGRKVKPNNYTLKGGVNMRFFFQSIRYSEDMDLDVQDIEVYKIKDAVMEILKSNMFSDILKPYGISHVVAPNLIAAKQTETTQRFKIHLQTFNGEDLFTKIEFSRRGKKGNVLIDSVPDIILRSYKMIPLPVPHYDINSALAQKIGALASRAFIQARDIFDIYILSSQLPGTFDKKSMSIGKAEVQKAYSNVFKVEFIEYRDAVVSYFSDEDQKIYGTSNSWEEIRLKVADLIEQTGKARE